MRREPDAAQACQWPGVDSAAAQVLQRAFDAAWKECAADFNSPFAARAARMVLARSILELAQAGVADVSLLTACGARELKALHAPDRRLA